MSHDITPEEKRIIVSVFNHFDTQGLGYINIDSLHKAVRKLMPTMDQQELDLLFQDIDENGDSNVTFDEFYNVIRRKWLGIGGEEDILQAFALIDTDKSGFISPAELRYLLTSVGENPLTEDEADELIHLADKDGDGLISYREFLEEMKPKN